MPKSFSNCLSQPTASHPLPKTQMTLGVVPQMYKALACDSHRVLFLLVREWAVKGSLRMVWDGGCNALDWKMQLK